MKKITLSLLAGLFVFTLTAGEKILTGKDAHDLMPGTEIIRFKDEMSIPSFIRFQEGQGPELNAVSQWLNNFFETQEGFGFVEGKVEEDAQGWTHVTFDQVFNGIPVSFANIKVHAKENKVLTISGYATSVMPEQGHGLSETQGLQSALGHINAQKYKWQDPAEEQHLKYETSNPEATYFPKGEAVYFPENIDFSNGSLIPAWKFNIYASKPLYRADVYVNAVTGEVLFENLRIKHADSTGTAETSFSGTRTIIADYLPSGVFRLRESNRGNGVETFDMLNGTNHGNADDLYDSTNTWPDTLRLRYATDAHWGAEMVYDYFMNVHNRNSINNNGFTLRSYVHYDVNYSNAFWDGQRMTYGDGNPPALPYTTLDIAGHEITHGLTDFTADLIYSYESGALNESFSDIFGCMVEYFGKPDPNKNWLMGEERGFALRSMLNPKSRQDPDTYMGQFWYTGTNDNGGVHTNSGVQNHWFYLLSLGGSGINDHNDTYNVTGLGIAKAEAIAFRNLTVYLSNSSDYEDARFYAIQSAIDLYGNCSPELASTVNAWYAVGVGDAYNSSVESDFIANVRESCEVPANVTFTNLSNYNASTYNWDFGDNTASTQENPFHSYTTPGNYTVKLTATGNSSCGSDVTTKTNYIIVAPPDDPVAPHVVSCDGEPAQITASSSDSVFWYKNLSANTPFHKGYTLVTNKLYDDTTFYVQSAIPGQDINAGAPSNNMGSGSYFSGFQYLIFDVYKPVKLKSVKVYADGTQYRGISLRNSNGQQLLSKLVLIPDGEQVVELDFNLVPGIDYQLGTVTNSPVELYRNSDGANYPYEIPGTISIKRSSAFTAPFDYYYFFYDWILEGEDCLGEKIPVNVTMDFDPNCQPFYFGIEENKVVEDLSIYPNPNSGEFNLSFELSESAPINLKLIDSKGSVVYAESLTGLNVGQNNVQVSKTGLTRGLYLVRLETAKGHYIKRIAIE